MTESDEQVISIPVWFLKLLGIIGAVLGTGLMGWLSWMTLTLVDLKSEVGTAAELKAQVNLLEKEVVEVKLNLAKLLR